jgi:hypothetical protein
MRLFSAGTTATTDTDTARSSAVEPHRPNKCPGAKADAKDEAADDNKLTKMKTILTILLILMMLIQN